MESQIKLSNDEIRQLIDIESFEFPKYTTQLMNLASQNAQATRPAVVGQMTDLIQELYRKKIEEWEKWYFETHPDAIEKATEKIIKMVDNFKRVIEKVDKKMIQKWVEDLVIIKTFIGLKFQEAVLIKTASLFNTNFRLSNRAEESKGIDGYVGDIPVSIKPESYKFKQGLSEKIDVKFIYYQKVKDGIKIDIDELI